MKEYRMSEPVLLNTLKKIYGSLMAISGKKILVIRDLKIALLLAVRNSVVYVTDDPVCAEQFRKNTEAGMGKDDIVILINKWTNKQVRKASFFIQFGGIALFILLLVAEAIF